MPRMRTPHHPGIPVTDDLELAAPSPFALDELPIVAAGSRGYIDLRRRRRDVAAVFHHEQGPERGPSTSGSNR